MCGRLHHEVFSVSSCLSTDFIFIFDLDFYNKYFLRKIKEFRRITYTHYKVSEVPFCSLNAVVHLSNRSIMSGLISSLYEPTLPFRIKLTIKIELCNTDSSEITILYFTTYLHDSFPFEFFEKIRVTLVYILM